MLRTSSQLANELNQKQSPRIFPQHVPVGLHLGHVTWMVKSVGVYCRHPKETLWRAASVTAADDTAAVSELTCCAKDVADDAAAALTCCVTVPAVDIAAESVLTCRVNVETWASNADSALSGIDTFLLSVNTRLPFTSKAMPADVVSEAGVLTMKTATKTMLMRILRTEVEELMIMIDDDQ